MLQPMLIGMLANIRLMMRPPARRLGIGLGESGHGEVAPANAGAVGETAIVSSAR
jgi:hypothetical protein